MSQPFSNPRPPRLERRSRNASRRGFTMAEMLTVIAVISILVAAAAPSFVRLMRDRRVSNAAHQVADMYRVARARAMGRGAAVLVRWEEAVPIPKLVDQGGHFVMREAIVGAGPGPALPASSCFAADWSDASTTSKFIRSFDERRAVFRPATARFAQPNGTALGFAEICFTPRGRTFFRSAPAGAFVPLAGVPRVEMINSETLMQRLILLPPSGVARVVSRI